MGGSVSCPCASGESGRHVLVIKQNGQVMKIKAGTHVKEILASNPRNMITKMQVRPITTGTAGFH